MAIFSTKEDDGMPETKGRGPARDGVLSIIAADLKVVGGLSTQGIVKVDGQVEGNIQAERQVLVSKGGAVQGDIHSNEVIIGGHVEGSVCATGRVEVQSTAKVDGDILTKRILVHEGGEVNGNLRMQDADIANGSIQSAASGDSSRSQIQATATTAK
jgi:cytoskeletal protein CcmA (bactofilin family)